MLTLKFRPRKFADLYGQSHVGIVLKTILSRREERGLPAGLLFAGTRGTGKTSTARIVAASLNCHNPEGVEPCGSCSPCISVQKTNCVFVYEVDAASNGSVEDIRKLKETTLYSHEGKVRVIILDEAQSLGKAAFDALLKQLEEPRPDTLFVLCTTEPDKFPETIMSRVMQFDFKQITPDTIVTRLQDIINKEGKAMVEAALLRAIASKAQGSMRDAIMTYEQLSNYKEGLTVKDFHEYFGLVDGDMYAAIVRAARVADIVTVKSLIKQSFSGGVDMVYFLDSFMRATGEDLASRKLTNEQALSMYRAASEVKGKLKVMTADAAVNFLFVHLLSIFHKDTVASTTSKPVDESTVEALFG